MRQRVWGIGCKTEGMRQWKWDRESETEGVRPEEWYRRSDTEGVSQKEWVRRSDTEGVIQNEWDRRNNAEGVRQRGWDLVRHSKRVSLLFFLFFLYLANPFVIDKHEELFLHFFRNRKVRNLFFILSGKSWFHCNTTSSTFSPPDSYLVKV